MEIYIGTKLIAAKPMTRADYNDYRGWDLPADEDGTDEGCLVEYLDGGDPNHKDHKGYISWSPREQFEKAYRATTGLPFGLAVEALKTGKTVCRAHWAGTSAFLLLVPGSTFKVNRAPLMGIYPEGTEINYQPHIDMKQPDGTVVPWVATQDDMLADDWMLVE